MKIKIDKMYNSVYEDKLSSFLFLFKFIDKEDLISSLQSLKSEFKVSKSAKFDYIEKKFNSLE